MKNRCARFGSSLLLSAMIAVGPAAQAADQGAIYLAKAIGEDIEAPPTKPKPQAAPKQPTKPTTTPSKTAPAAPQPPVAATKPSTPPEPPPKEPAGMSTKTKVWIGAGVAALLAAAAAGGGSSKTPHP